MLLVPWPFFEFLSAAVLEKTPVQTKSGVDDGAGERSTERIERLQPMSAQERKAMPTAHLYDDVRARAGPFM